MYTCCKCGSKASFTLLGVFVHDLKCWSVCTAFFNAYVKLFHANKYGLN